MNEKFDLYTYVLTPFAWSGDITYIRTHGGFMYLAAVIDWHS